MENKNWKERIIATRTSSAEKRGEIIPKTPQDIKARLDEIKDRGGIVFVSKEINMKPIEEVPIG